MHWNVVSVKPIAHGALAVRFADGTEGYVRLEDSHLYGVFAPLKNPTLFAQVCVEDGAVSWPGEIDLAPDAMYNAIKDSGEWVLR
jgi:hypothetical protein